ncbi:MAG TPA: EamA family transporter [Acidobacteriaceae bacterium]|jgi:drug/metabolite transporter (DMT)-like permease
MDHRATHRNRKLLAPLAFACVYFFWGSSFIAIRYGTQLLHPAFVAGIRYLIAGLVLFGFLLARGHSVRMTRRDLLRVAGLGVLMFTCNTILLSYGGRILPAGLTALIISTIPLFIGLLETSIPGGARLSLWGWAGTITGFLGLTILLRHSFHAGPLTRTTGLAAAALITAAFAWALGSVLIRRTRFTASSFVTTCWQMLIGGTIDVLIGVGDGGLGSSQWTSGAWLAVLYLGVFGTLVGYTSYAYLLRNVAVTSVATYAYINPIVAVLLGWMLLGEHLVPGQWLGMSIVLASVAIVAMVQTSPRSARAAEPELSEAAA